MDASRWRHPMVLAALASSLLGSACATAGGPAVISRPATGTTFDSYASRSPKTVLTGAELVRESEFSTLDAVRHLRPEFLLGSMRGSISAHPEIALYLDKAYAGTAADLNSIPVAEIRDVVFMQPTEATMLFGSTCRCANGALVVRTWRVGAR